MTSIRALFLLFFLTVGGHSSAAGAAANVQPMTDSPAVDCARPVSTHFSSSGTLSSYQANELLWRITSFLHAAEPDYSRIAEAMALLDSLDIYDPVVLKHLNLLVLQFQTAAHMLVRHSPAGYKSVAELAAAAQKLNLLNTDTVRSLLGQDDLRAQVERAAPLYDQAMQDTKLDLAGKIALIKAGLQ